MGQLVTKVLVSRESPLPPCQRWPGFDCHIFFVPQIQKLLGNSREKWRKQISVMGELRGQVRVRPIDKLDETCTNKDDRMMLVRHRSGDCVMS